MTIRLLLAGKAGRVEAWYQDLGRDARFQVLGYAVDAEELAQRAGMYPADVLLLDAALFAGPQVLVEALAALPPMATHVFLPAEATDKAEQTVASAPTVAGVWKGEVEPAEVAGAICEAQEQPPVDRPAPPPPVTPQAPPARPAQQPQVRQAPPGRVVALWSGTAGGAGRTTLALILSIYAAERGADPVLLALSEPAVSAYLSLSRTPNAVDFAGNLQALEQMVAWETEEGKPAALPVVLGPGRPGEGEEMDGQQVTALTAAARAAHALVVLDLPVLVPGSNVWATRPLLQTTDVVLVPPLTAAGVAATVEALATLRDVGSAARVHLVVNRRAAVSGGLSGRRLTESVSNLWGSCPDVVVEVPHLAELPGLLDRGELSSDERLNGVAVALGEAVAGLPRPEPEPEKTPKPATVRNEPGPRQAVRRSDGKPRLIRIKLK